MQKIIKHSSMFLSLLLVSFIGVSCGGDNSSMDETTITPTEEPTMEPIVIEDNLNSSINYQIFPRTFADSNGDGIGDLNGIKAKIPYLKALGVKNIWLCPIHETSSAHGYDVIDYYTIAKDLGTMKDFEALVKELKANNMGLIMDMVFNHVSSKSTYFKEAYADYDAISHGKPKPNSKAKWFNFSSQPKAKYIKVGNYYVESRFDNSGMLDFNLKNKGVIEELGNILNFWAEKGVAGYRFDAVKYFVGGSVNQDTIKILNNLKAFQPDLYYIGEAWENSNDTLVSYFTSEFDSFFAFPTSTSGVGSNTILSATTNALPNKLISGVKNHIKIIEDGNKVSNTQSVPSFFLSNHDMDRTATYSSKPEVLKLVGSVNYLLPGTPFMYYGEELGMKGERFKGVMTDADRRMAMVFEDSFKCNELNETTYKDQIKEGVDTQLRDPNSILSHYQRVTSLRNKMGAMTKTAKFSEYDSKFSKDNFKVLAYNLTNNDESYTILTNLGQENVSVTLVNDYNNVVGYVNAKDYSNKYELNDKSLALPSYGTLVLQN